MKKLLFIFSLFFILTSCRQKQAFVDKEKERIDKVCDSIMQIIGTRNIHDALQLLKQNSVMTPTSIDSLQVTIENQADKIFLAYGKMLSSEFIVERKIKDIITKRFYILKFDKYYLKFDFTLYNNGRCWTITTFNYNDELIELLY